MVFFMKRKKTFFCVNLSTMKKVWYTKCYITFGVSNEFTY